jgi:mono/diheme cytochrome c family protein
MQRLKRVLVGLGIGAVLLTALASGVLVFGSERILDQRHALPPSSFVAMADRDRLAEGERLAHTRGCTGCHGPQLEGRVVMDAPWMGRIVAGNLTRVVRDHDDAELERVIRQGVRKDGRSVWMMPSSMFAHLTDEDLGLIIGYMRSVPPRDGPGSSIEPRLLARLGILLGQLRPEIAYVDPDTRPRAPDPADPLDLGRYLAMTACIECHGDTLLGDGMGSPPLTIVAAYPPEAFSRLMREGVALGDRELGMMSGVARFRFAHFNDTEIGALHAYLSGLAAPAD